MTSRTVFSLLAAIALLGAIATAVAYFFGLLSGPSTVAYVCPGEHRITITSQAAPNPKPLALHYADSVGKPARVAIKEAPTGFILDWPPTAETVFLGGNRPTGLTMRGVAVDGSGQLAFAPFGPMCATPPRK